MRRALISILLFAFTCASFAQNNQSLSYDELQTQAIDLVRKANIDSAIIVMEYAVKNFPEEDQWSTGLLAQIFIRADRNPEAVEIWKSGMEKGYNYNLTNPAFLQYFENDKDFLKLLDIEKAWLDTAHIKHEVNLPSNYISNKPYPVLFIFHGNNRNLEKSKASWSAQTMKDEYITVFLQSYIRSNDINYVWKTSDVKTEEEIKLIYDKILADYSVDTSRIIIAGMSAGGMLALELAFKEFIPVSGSVLNCPVIPENINDEQIRQFVAKNRRIGIITGEQDFALASQESLIESIKEQGGEGKITINKDAGHEFVKDFSALLDEYLGWIIE
ncbi:MAG: alpha/beta hydrolase fold domain-containing protein [Bacteroidales bacterium]|nr:alpha/beta hydrolase fold domain-containing protein [Bacteroidales bacterium]